MTRVLVAAASALFLGAVITEIQARLFPGQPFAMLLLSVAAIFIGSIVTLRAAPRPSARQRSCATTNRNPIRTTTARPVA